MKTKTYNIIYTGTCPGCGSQMPTPAPDMIGKRYHPCPNCPPVSGHAKHWRAAYAGDASGNLHITYADTRNSKQGLDEVVQYRVEPELKRRLDEISDERVRDALRRLTGMI